LALVPRTKLASQSRFLKLHGTSGRGGGVCDPESVELEVVVVDRNIARGYDLDTDDVTEVAARVVALPHDSPYRRNLVTGVPSAAASLANSRPREHMHRAGDARGGGSRQQPGTTASLTAGIAATALTRSIWPAAQPRVPARSPGIRWLGTGSSPPARGELARIEGFGYVPTLCAVLGRNKA
jgi:hypothetical protein